MQSSSDTGASKLATIDKGYFTLRAMTKEIQELSNPIGRELNIGPNGFTLKSKPQYNKMT
jgi:hypothetical protein